MQNARPTKTAQNKKRRQSEAQREGPFTIMSGVAGVAGVAVAVVTAIVTVIGVIVAVVQCSASSSSSRPATPALSPTSAVAAPAILSQGHQKLANVQGVDLDAGQVEDQDQPGVDVSPSKTADLLNAMSNGVPRFALPAENGSGPELYGRCHNVSPGSWTRTLQNLYARHIADTICVRTDQGNLSALTLTHVPSVAEQYVEFDFVTWRDR